VQLCKTIERTSLPCDSFCYLGMWWEFDILARHRCRASRTILAGETRRRIASYSRSWIRSSGKSIFRIIAHPSLSSANVGCITPYTLQS
jgi:hypothetical protein